MVEQSKDIVAIGFATSAEWHEVPLDGSALDWPSALASQLGTPEDGRAAALREQLRILQENLLPAGAELDLTAAVWIPYPETGSVNAVMGFSLLPMVEGLSVADAAEALARFEEQDDESMYLVVEQWQGTVDVGAFAASRQALVNPEPDDEQGWMEERVDFVVLPTGARQMVHVFFSTDNVIAFEDIAAQTTELVATMTVEYDGVAV
ncbi:hypothetical protein [Gryllotalpicola ginsengisoli]|uniref:hypothetical protein n=1 Tax=Gryllotalpicola ginsengisoli TaxID=444608 RepID=UPI0003B714E4|nr:hypothetical protein [Gryllotalpicola ginsengisoli]